MDRFFASLYEWFGFVQLYSKDFGEYLRGWDFACVGYFAIPWYLYIGWLMIISTTVIFGLQYDLVSSTRYTQRGHWSLVAFIIVSLNFLLAFTIPFVALFTGSYCLRLKLSVFDCLGFGISNAIWSLILFILLTGITPFSGLIIKWRRPIFRKQ